MRKCDLFFFFSTSTTKKNAMKFNDLFSFIKQNNEHTMILETNFLK